MCLSVLDLVKQGKLYAHAVNLSITNDKLNCLYIDIPKNVFSSLTMFLISCCGISCCTYFFLDIPFSGIQEIFVAMQKSRRVDRLLN